jgi:putative ABC transport system ATP-binding protein
MPVVELLSVSKDYRSDGGVVHALRDTTLTIGLGEFVAIVGTSGSGKSTLMNILGCLDRPSNGVYRLAGFDVGRRAADSRALIRNRLIGFIFQGFNLLARTTALENVELPLQYRGIGRSERRKLASAALGAVGLEHRLLHKPNELSGGQQQRVAIARALVTNPPILLADEPTGNLDTRTSLEVLAFLQQLNRERRITVVLVTHEADIAACASRIIAMRDGMIVSDTQNVPTDAAALLRALPPSATTATGGPLQMPGSSAKAPTKIPTMVWGAMVLGAFVGFGLGLAYDRWILGAQAWWPPLFFAVAGECMAAEKAGRRRLGKIGWVLGARIAIPYTALGGLVLGALAIADTSWWPEAMSMRLATVGPAGIASTGAFIIGALAFVALLRALLIAALASLGTLPERPRPRTLSPPR